MVQLIGAIPKVRGGTLPSVTARRPINPVALRSRIQGWFAHANIPAYCLYLTIHFSKEERYLLRHTGIGYYVLFRALTPPDVTDLEEIKKLKAENFGLFFVRDLFSFGRKTLLGEPQLWQHGQYKFFTIHLPAPTGRPNAKNGYLGSQNSILKPLAFLLA